jgi:ABC-type nitrate/sulfonate/bicarbonate transport system permease component
VAGDFWLGCASLAVGVVVWQAITLGLDIPPRVLPGPWAILLALGEYARSGDMLTDVAVTLRRLVAGVSIGVTLGVCTGFMIAWYKRLRAAFAPLLAFFFSMPHIAVLPLLIIWLGVGDAFKVALVIVGAFFVSVWNTVAGVNGVSASVIMASRNLGASDWQLFLKVLIPGAMPLILASLRMSISLGLIGVIVAEMLVSTDGLGHYIADAGDVLETSKVFSGLAMAGLLGLVGMKIMDLAQVRWLRHYQHGGSTA